MKFSIRELLLFTTIMALILGWSVDRLATLEKKARLHSLERYVAFSSAVLYHRGYEVHDNRDASELEDHESEVG